MVSNTVKEFRCSACPYRFTLTEQIPVCEGGVQMLPGRTYCKGGKNTVLSAVVTADRFHLCGVQNERLLVSFVSTHTRTRIHGISTDCSIRESLCHQADTSVR